MKKGTLITLIVAFSALILGLIIAFIAAASVRFDPEAFLEEEPVNYSRKEKLFDKDITSIDIEYQGHVTIRQGHVQQFSITYDDSDDAPVSLSRKLDGKLVIREEREMKWIRYLIPRFHFGKEEKLPELILNCPRGTAFDEVKIHTVSGSIQIDEALRISNICILKSTSGDISASVKLGLSCGCYVDSTSGDIRLDGKESIARFIACSSTSGGVSLSNFYLTEGVTVNSTSGDLHLSNLSMKTDLELSSTSGKIEISGITADQLRIHSTSGDISFDQLQFNEADISATSGDIQGSVQEDVMLTAHSTSGDIRLPNGIKTGGRSKISTTSGDITIQWQD